MLFELSSGHHLNGPSHDVPVDMYRPGLPQPIHTPDGLDQHCRIRGRLQQVHMVCCKQHKEDMSATVPGLQ